MILIGRHYDGGYTTKFFGPFDDEKKAEDFLIERNFEKNNGGKAYRSCMAASWAPGTVPLSLWYSSKAQSGAVIVKTGIEDPSKFSDMYGEDIWSEENGN